MYRQKAAASAPSNDQKVMGTKVHIIFGDALSGAKKLQVADAGMIFITGWSRQMF
jgi:hypothetical protein